MYFESVLKRMPTEFLTPVRYFLDMGNDFIILNHLLEKKISFSFKKYQCLGCGDDIPIFSQGMCKKCYYENPKSGEWVIKPELSKAHLDIEDRDLSYEKEIQLSQHVVYLSNTGNVKVGVTRKTQIPYRWIDQGADEALIIMETPNRYLAGQAEVAIKQYVNDKTSWKIMLKGHAEKIDLKKIQEKVKSYLSNDLLTYWIDDSKAVKIKYPVLKNPQNIKSVNLEKTPEFEGVLTGIKGQYLIFDDGRVFNVRNHSGYVVRIEF